MTSGEGAPARQVGYRVVLPPGWTRIPLRDNPSGAIDAILDRSFAELPKDSYGPIRTELRKRLVEQVTRARDNEGIDLYLPVDRVHGQTIAASFVVALLDLDVASAPSAEDLLVAFAADTDGTTVTEVDGSPAVRVERVVAAVAGAEDEAQYGTRRVDYLVAIPQGSDQWLSVSFSTAGDGDPEGDVALLLVGLFDAVMSTFAWTLE